MSKILSIVVPSYNCEDSLPEIIPSFLNISKELQDALEIIIVNDGSKDNTLAVAQELQQSAPHVIRVEDKENGGHGSTINRGIDVATGTYFKVVDGDDYLDGAALEKLMDFLFEHDVDQVVSPFYNVYNNPDGKRQEIVDYPGLIDGNIYDYDALLQEIQTIPMMHSLIYKTQKLKENGIRISEHMFYVDNQYNVYPMPYLQKVAYVHAPVYLYQLGDENQSVSASSYLKNKEMHIKVIQSIVNFKQEHASELTLIKAQLIDELISGLTSLQANIFLSMPDRKQGKKEFLAFNDYLSKNHPYTLEHPTGYKTKILNKAPFLFNVMSTWYQNNNR